MQPSTNKKKKSEGGRGLEGPMAEDTEGIPHNAKGWMGEVDTHFK